MNKYYVLYSPDCTIYQEYASKEDAIKVRDEYYCNPDCKIEEKESPNIFYSITFKNPRFNEEITVYYKDYISFKKGCKRYENMPEMCSHVLGYKEEYSNSEDL